MPPTKILIGVPANDEWLYHHKYPRDEDDDSHDPVKCVNLGDALDKLLEKHQKRYLDGVDCGPGESKKCVKN